jgi:hypothetical protein
VAWRLVQLLLVVTAAAHVGAGRCSIQDCSKFNWQLMKQQQAMQAASQGNLTCVVVNGFATRPTDQVGLFKELAPNMAEAGQAAPPKK